MVRPFHDLSWYEKIIVIAGGLFILFSIYHGLWLLFREEPPKKPEPITISTANPISLTDPSLAFGSDGQGFMAATAFETSRDGNNVLLHTQILSLAGHTGTVLPMHKVNMAKPESLTAPDGITNLARGVWRYETPALVYDPDDAGKEWKLFAYKYFWEDRGGPQATLLAQRYGVITYRTTSNPASHKWSQETWLFAADPQYPPFPYRNLVQLHINPLHPSLKNVLSYSRPSVIYKNGGLFMTLSAFTGRDVPGKIVMLASLDHGKSWGYINTPLKTEDAKSLGYDHISGATLAEHNGTVYLLATFGTKELRNDGVHVIPFTNLMRGQLARNNGNGGVQIANHIRPPSDYPSEWGGGFGMWHDNLGAKTGLLMPEIQENGRRFNIMQTRQPLLKEK